ncbi:MAG: winged helix-turn-helix domain-containing protein, partial [Desulfovibrio sp.]
LDLMLPGMDGCDVCRRLKAQPVTAAIPVLMLTARGEEVDRIVGLTLGADDYVVKPFSVRELVLRIRAILRRGSRPGTGTALCRGALLLDVEAHRVTLDGQEVALTATEFRLLEDLMRHAGAVRTREQLLNAVWGYSFEGYARTVDTHVRRLRAKLGEEAAALETVRGVGYRLRG